MRTQKLKQAREHLEELKLQNQQLVERMLSQQAKIIDIEYGVQCKGCEEFVPEAYLIGGKCLRCDKLQGDAMIEQFEDDYYLAEDGTVIERDQEEIEVN